MSRTVVRGPREEGGGGLDTVMVELRKTLTDGGLVITVSIDPDWAGATVMLTQPKHMHVATPEIELAALKAARDCILTEIASREQ